VAAYNASKAGVAGLTRSLAVEWAAHGVCVNAIAPGVFRNEPERGDARRHGAGAGAADAHAMRRFGRVEELQAAAVFLASEAASFVTGTLLTVDGGFLASAVNQ
jgi:NAD(P)-dependent dehydrogenase (short-subunit alcohol dehydrogenase family)